MLDKGSSRSSTPSVDVVNKRYSADLSRLEHNDLPTATPPPPAPTAKPGEWMLVLSVDREFNSAQARQSGYRFVGYI